MWYVSYHSRVVLARRKSPETIFSGFAFPLLVFDTLESQKSIAVTCNLS